MSVLALLEDGVLCGFRNVESVNCNDRDINWSPISNMHLTHGLFIRWDVQDSQNQQKVQSRAEMIMFCFGFIMFSLLPWFTKESFISGYILT